MSPYSFPGTLALVHAQPSSDAAVFTHFRAGQQAIRTGQLEAAVAEFNQVLKVSPGLVEAQVNLGLAYHLLGQYAESTGVLSKVARQEPGLPAANLFLGIGYLKLGLHEKAVLPLERVILGQPDNREARRALAECRLAHGDYGAAAQQFRALFALEPDKAEAWFRLGRDYTEAASALVRRMSLQHRRSIWGHRLAADLYSQGQRWGIAEQEYREALAAGPAQSGFHAGLGNVYLRQQQFPQAIAEFLSELKDDPDDVQARLGLAEVHLAEGNLAAAREQINEIWKTAREFLVVQRDFPKLELGRDLVERLIVECDAGAADAASHFLSASLARRAGKALQAHTHESALLSLAKDGVQEQSGEPPAQLCRAHRYLPCVKAQAASPHPDAAQYLMLGKALLALREFESASDALGAALALAREDPEVMYHLARSYQVLADECFSRLEQLAPESWRTHQMRAEAHKLRFEDQQAVREYQHAVQLRPDSAELYEELASLYLPNHLPEAQAALERALKLEPARARSLYLLGQVYVTAREQDKAIPYLQKALRYDANLLNARATLGKAYLRAGKPGAAVPEIVKALPLDYHGDLHFLLYRAYRDLGKQELARAALKRSEEMRKNSVDRDREKLERWLRE